MLLSVRLHGQGVGWRHMRMIGVLMCMLAPVAACGPGTPVGSERGRFLEVAIQAGVHLESLHGAAGLIPDRLGEGSSSQSLGTGAAGRAVYLAELFSATSDTRFLELARRQAWAALADESSVRDNYSLYGGMGGIAFAAAEVGRLASDAGLVEASDRWLAAIASASPSRGGPGWGMVNDVIGGLSGTGLTLLDGYERNGDERLLAAAIEIGDTLLARADSLTDGRLRWQRGVETPFDLPNFSHGTAGIGFFMRRLGEAATAPRFDEAAMSAVRYLVSIADQQNGLFLVPYGVPNEDYVTRYDIGWAHGPAGSGRIHYADWVTSRTESAEELLDRAARTIVASGVPLSTSDSSIWAGPFRIDRRFGMAGTVPFLIDASLELGDESYSLVAGEIAEHILRRATSSVEGTYWSVPLHGFQGGEGSAVFTGYFYGTAGLGLAMLEAHYSMSGRRPAIRFPDDPVGMHLGGEA